MIKKIINKLITILVILIIVLNFSSPLIFALEENKEDITDGSIQEEISKEKIQGEWKYKTSNKNYAIITGYIGQEEEITIPETIENYTITQIGNYAFSNCINLKNIYLPENLEKIGQQAFSSCESIKTIKLPESIIELGERAFENCVSLQEINYPRNLQKAYYGVFKECSQLAKIEIPEGITKIVDSIFSEYLGSEINLPSTITEIGNYAFSNCINLKNIYLPENLEKIGQQAFSSCESIKAIKLPENVTELGERAFENCVNLQEINYPRNLQKAYYGVFKECNQLTKVEIPEGVTKIADNIFSAYLGSQINLPSTINEIGKYAFCECTNLRNINLPEKLQKIDQEAFKECKNLTTITLPDSITTLGLEIFNGCDNLTIVTGKYSVANVELIRQGINKFSFSNDIRTTQTKVLEEEKSSYTASFSSSYEGGSIQLTCKYSIPENKKDIIKNIEIALNKDNELITNSLYINKKLCQNYQENSIQGGAIYKLLIPVEETEGTITLHIKNPQNKNVVSYAIVNLENNEEYDIIGIINNPIESISIETASITNNANIEIRRNFISNARNRNLYK